MTPQRDREAEPREGDATPAEILAPAPVLALVAFGVGVGMHLAAPVDLLPAAWNLVLGGLAVVLGGGILLLSLREMRRIGTSPPHEDEPEELLTDGPFAHSRNPLYLGVCVVYLGATALLDSVWPILPLVVLVAYFDRVAAREEAYLEATFGDEFRRYREDVRRWL